MRKILFFASAIIFLVACSTSTKIINSWRDPDAVVNKDGIRKFVVAALLKNQAVRRQVEDNMASMFPGKAVQSYKEFGNDTLNENDQVYNQKLANEGYDGIVVMRLINVDKSQHYVPESYPFYYQTWRGYWGFSSIGFRDPRYYTTDKNYEVEVNVYSLKSNKLIWTGNTSTIDPPGKEELFKSVGKAVYDKMIKEGFLK